MNYIKLYQAILDLDALPTPSALPPADLLDLRERLVTAQIEVDAQIDAYGSLGDSPEERLESVASFLWPNSCPEGSADLDSAELQFGDVLLSLFMQPGRRTFDIVVTCTNAGRRRAGLSLTTTRDELARVVLELLETTLASTHEIEASAKASRDQVRSLLTRAVRPT